MFKVNNKYTRTAPLLTLNILHTWSSVSIVNFEQVNAGWVGSSTIIILQTFD